MARVLLVHGWGLGPDLWDAVAARLPLPPARLDLGYFGPPRLDELPDGPFVGAGHSFGCLWLLRHWPQGCVGLAAINGFGRFAAGPDFPEGAALRPLQRMIARFAEAPDTVAADFLARCGAPPPAAPVWGSQGADHLLALRDWDERARCRSLGVPVVALCGEDDPIAPPALSAASLPGARIQTVAGGGHLLPLTAPDACAAAIAALAAEVSP